MKSIDQFTPIFNAVQIRIIHEDITALTIEAIVNASDTRFSGGGGVDRAIHQSAGTKLTEACQRLKSCRPGQAKITPGFDLPADWVIHTVGPVWKGGHAGEPKLLRDCYANSLELALSHRIKNIAFPCISTGVYAYPKPAAAHVAINVMKAYSKHFEWITVCCYNKTDKLLYETLLSSA